MTIYATNGAKLYIGGALANKNSDFALSDFAGQTWAEIGETEGLGSIGDTSSEITFDAVSSGRQKRLKGNRSGGAMEVVCGIDYGDAGQQALLTAEKSTGDFAFKVVLNDARAVRTAAVTMTIAAPGVVTWNAHGLTDGQKVKFSTTGALPTGLTAGTTYYVVNAAANTFQVAATLGGAAIATTSTQSGAHTVETVPGGSERYFVAAVGSAVEALDSANNVMKLNASLWVNSNVVRVNPN